MKINEIILEEKQPSGKKRIKTMVKNANRRFIDYIKAGNIQPTEEVLYNWLLRFKELVPIVKPKLLKIEQQKQQPQNDTDTQTESIKYRGNGLLTEDQVLNNTEILNIIQDAIKQAWTQNLIPSVSQAYNSNYSQQPRRRNFRTISIDPDDSAHQKSIVNALASMKQNDFDNIVNTVRKTKNKQEQ